MTVQVLLYKGRWNAPIDAGIMLWSQDDTSHSALVRDEVDEDGFKFKEVWEFTRWGFQTSNLDDYEGDWELREFRDLTHEKIWLMRREMERLAALSGKYDWKALGGLCVRLPVALTGRALGVDYTGYNPLQSDDRFFCSEFVARTCEAAGYSHGMDSSLVLPADHKLVDWLEVPR